MARPHAGGQQLEADPLGSTWAPNHEARSFDLVTFGQALEQGDLARLLACYAPAADIRVIGPDNPRRAARTFRGTRAIWSWLVDCDGLDVDVTHLVDGGDRIAFRQGWRQPDDRVVTATSTAELSGNVISAQHTILDWANSRA